MTGRDLPTIIAVDDEPELIEGEVRLGLDGKAIWEVLHPDQVKSEHLEKADLILVDYRLDHWSERDSLTSLSLQPATGLALAVVFREYLDRLNRTTLTAFALHSAHLDEIRGRLPTSIGEHVIARLNNLEWTFPKTEPKRWDQMAILASAVKQLPEAWQERDPVACESQALQLLNLSRDADWFDRAWRTIRTSQPPIHDLCGGAHGLLFVRWLLHQVLPYPCFLLEEHWVAARLRLTMPAFKAVMAEDSKLSKRLNDLCYTGILSGFLGDRWWRSGLEDYVWSLTQGQAMDVKSFHGILEEQAGHQLEAVRVNPAVVPLNAALKPEDEFIAPEQAVRIRPDQWPAFADDAWTSIAAVRGNTMLRALVDFADLNRVEVEEGDV